MTDMQQTAEDIEMDALAHRAMIVDDAIMTEFEKTGAISEFLAHRVCALLEDFTPEECFNFCEATFWENDIPMPEINRFVPIMMKIDRYIGARFA